MKVESVTCIPFTLPLRQEVRFAAGVMTNTEHVLIEIHTDQGIVGRAEAPARPYLYGESQKSIVAAVTDWFAPMLRGEDPFAIERILARFASIEHNNTAKGALDIALHDIVGQASGVPCHRLLGGWHDEAQVIYVVGAGAPEAMRDECLAMRERYGIIAFKLKIGLDLGKDVDMLRVMRAAFPDGTLIVDGNQALAAEEALRVLAVCAEQGVAWAEEPCHTNDRVGRRRVAAQSPVPILGDDSCRTLGEVAREIDDAAVHMVSIKLARCGYRMGRDILGLCLASRIRPVSGSQGDSGIGVLAGLHFCVAHRATQIRPAELCFHLNLADDLLAEPLAIANGRLKASNAPGLGITLDPGKLAHYRND
jgi:L-alanine-DL-glutamate epimerase-like enolase superfamily enzyme